MTALRHCAECSGAPAGEPDPRQRARLCVAARWRGARTGSRLNPSDSFDLCQTSGFRQPEAAPTTGMEATMLGCGKILLALALMMAAPVATIAQTTDNQPAPSGQPSLPRPSQPAAQAPASPPPAQPQAELLKPEQLEALVAPIALYPDELLANVLAASTYPLEVVQADRWAKANKSLQAVDKQAWDDSVKALASTPDVLSMMSDKVDWTKDLGDAVLAQQPDVMDAIQRLRAKAQKNNKLVT